MTKWIGQTNPDQLFPIGMIEVGIQDLLPMHQGHTPKAPGDVVQWGPQCLNDLTINLFGSWNIAWRKTG